MEMPAHCTFVRPSARVLVLLSAAQAAIGSVKRERLVIDKGDKRYLWLM
jgi:hypothetical protein